MENLSFQMCIAQLVGFVALLCGVGAFLQKNDLAFKRRMTLFCMVEAIHFLLLSAYSASFGCFVNGMRSFASSKTRSKIVMVFFLIFLWSVGLLAVASFRLELIQELYCTEGWYGLLSFWILQHPVALLPLLGSTVGTVGLFLLSGINLRYAILTCSSLWFVHNITVVSIGPSIMEAVFILINVKTIYTLKCQAKLHD